MFEAFAESKRVYLDRLKNGQIEKPTAVDEVHKKVMAITGDPLPYGIEPNRRVLEELIGHAMTQRIITTAVQRGGALRARHARSEGVILRARSCAT